VVFCSAGFLCCGQCCIVRVGHNYIYTHIHVYIYIIYGYIRYFGQGNHQIYGHIRCICTVLAETLCIALAVAAMCGIGSECTHAALAGVARSICS
jgi:hypothetical protein